MPAVTSNAVAPWPHRLAVLMACATFPLLWVGGLVTTYKAGMAVPDWPSTYGYNLLLYPWQTWLLGPWDLFIEHGHRLLGAALGMLAIAHLVAAWWLAAPRKQVLWAAVALFAVCLQGSLGGMRVLFDEVTLAKLHGCLGPAVFALIVGVATMSSRLWQFGNDPASADVTAKTVRLSLLTAALAYVQLVLGAQLRHVAPGLGHGAFRVLVWFHLLGALALLVHAILLFRQVRKDEPGNRLVLTPARALLGLVLLQVVLGCAAWVVKYQWPSWLPESVQSWSPLTVSGSPLQAGFVTAHVATGSLILATSVVAALWSWRGMHWPRLTSDLGGLA